MSKPNIAIIGLGRVGAPFLNAVLQKRNKINLVCVSEQADTPGKAKARHEGVDVVTLDQIIARGDQIDAIFELTGIQSVRKELRDKLMSSGNTHTVVASETIANIIGILISDSDLPVVDGHKAGY